MSKKRLNKVVKKEAKEQVIATIDSFFPQVQYAVESGKRLKRVGDAFADETG